MATPAEIDEIHSTIIADNPDDNAVNGDDYSPDVYNDSGTITLEEYNLVGKYDGASGVFVIGDDFDIIGTEISAIDAMLTDLDYNGGFSATLALLPGSPAINRELNPYELFYAQRSAPHFRVKLSKPDIGSFEFRPALCKSSDEE